MRRSRANNLAGRSPGGLPRPRGGHNHRGLRGKRERCHRVSRPPARAHGGRPGGGRRRPPLRGSGCRGRRRHFASDGIADQLPGLLLGRVGTGSSPGLGGHDPHRHATAGRPPERPLPPRQSGSDLARGWKPVGLSGAMAAPGPRRHQGSVAARRGHGRHQRGRGIDGRGGIRCAARYRHIGRGPRGPGERLGQRRAIQHAPARASQHDRRLPLHGTLPRGTAARVPRAPAGSAPLGLVRRDRDRRGGRAGDRGRQLPGVLGARRRGLDVRGDGSGRRSAGQTPLAGRHTARAAGGWRLGPLALPVRGGGACSGTRGGGGGGPRRCGERRGAG